ncbi:MAG: hypothetical protein C0608_12005 [Deltaproteobacteria bacterium]|nr:MAG: hypothetical protein C0608_12005 [Deltaproteobacteria bacterium]
MKKVREFMTGDVLTVMPTTPVGELAKLFLDTGVSGFPVVDENKRLVGVVSERDLIHRDQKLHIPTFFTLFDSVFSFGANKKLEEEMRVVAASTVGDIMKEAVTVSPDATHSDVATLMGDSGAYTLPVVDENGDIIGIVGKRDIIKAMGDAI